MKKIFILLIILLLGFNLSYSQKVFKIGDPAPTISIAQWITKPELKGNPFLNRTVILEFWATWCGPCRKIIPHINSLVKKFKSDSVIFVSISKESPQKVKSFLKKNSMEAYIAIDANGISNKNYKIKYIPRAYVIDSFGRIIWEGHPANLNDKILDIIINKKYLKKKK